MIARNNCSRSNEMSAHHRVKSPLTITEMRTLDHALLVSTPGKAPSYPTVVAVFLQVARSIGLRGNPGQPGPRIHDLRHTFAVRSLEQCPRDREAVARHVVALSTYLGHAHVTDTYWYLHATPILMGQIAEAGEALHRGRAS
jgi:integrase